MTTQENLGQAMMSSSYLSTKADVISQLFPSDVDASGRPAYKVRLPPSGIVDIRSPISEPPSIAEPTKPVLPHQNIAPQVASKSPSPSFPSASIRVSLGKYNLVSFEYQSTTSSSDSHQSISLTSSHSVEATRSAHLKKINLNVLSIDEAQSPVGLASNRKLKPSRKVQKQGKRKTVPKSRPVMKSINGKDPGEGRWVLGPNTNEASLGKGIEASVQHVAARNYRTTVRDPTFHPSRSTPSIIGRTSTSPKKPGTNSPPRVGRPPASYVNATGAMWASQDEIGVKFFDLPIAATTKDIWDSFSREGTIIGIEIYADNKGQSRGTGIVRFKPAPRKDFWTHTARFPYPIRVRALSKEYHMKLSLAPFREPTLYKGLNNGDRRYPETMLVEAESLDFGVMHMRDTMLCLHEIKPIPGKVITLRQNLRHREIEISFPVMSSYQNGYSSLYKFVVSMAQRIVIHEVETQNAPANLSTLVLSIETPPAFYRKYEDNKTHQTGTLSWRSTDSWFRATDIVADRELTREAPTSLRKHNSIINLGRWTTYRLVIDSSKNATGSLEEIVSALQDFNIEVTKKKDFVFLNEPAQSVWDLVDTIWRPPYELRFSEELLDEDTVHLPFDLRYQLEVCISNGRLCEYNLDKRFLKTLQGMERSVSVGILEQLSAQDFLENIWYNPMDMFSTTQLYPSKLKSKQPHYCVVIRGVVVTPTTVYFATPSMEISNRVIRHYAEHSDRFLRVRFTDEKHKGKIHWTAKETQNELFTRVKRTMMNGIKIGDRHYNFLAFGNSQFREHGAYFFCPDAHLSACRIRKWMGNFEDIKVVAKYAARLGQCFSTTRAIHGVKPTIIEMEDIFSEDGKHIFTDGVGLISPFLGQVAADEIGILERSNGEIPSVIQFRLGGSKGVLAVWPHAKKREIHIRPSQYKFHAEYEGLEIIRWSQFSGSSLNRQLIAVLSTLGVPNVVFIQMLKEQLSELSDAMTNEKVALKRLQTHIDPNQMSLVMAKMILDGFQKARDPFMMSLLHLWRAWSIKYLKEKAKIMVRDGAVLLGCVDETGKLKGHFNALQPKGRLPTNAERTNSLPEVFVQIQRTRGPAEDRNNKPQILTGIMILARNPSLHPGDIRVVRGVDIPDLHHMKDVIVLPRSGDRDVAGMCSGGDLDGDDYVVIWDPNLIPREWNHEPMDYTAPEPVRVDKEVTMDDITSFFVNFMKNDSLPDIAQAHVAWADHSEHGVKDPRCIELAALHSKAVDYPKSGVHATMPSYLKPSKWPHFMGRKNSYKSRNILGRLYDEVEMVDFMPDYDSPFDDRILTAYKLDNRLLKAVAEIKSCYDEDMRRLMTQHDIATDCEIWSTFVMDHARQSKDFKFHEEIGHLSAALKDKFRDECFKAAGGREFAFIGPFVAAMYKVTSDEMLHALEQCRQVVHYDGSMDPVRAKTKKTMPMISFPWLFPEVLGKIALGVKSIDIEQAHEHLAEMFKVPRTKPAPKAPKDDEEDVVETKQGITHRGELLALFDPLYDHQAHQNTQPSPTKRDYSHHDLLGLEFDDAGALSSSDESIHGIMPKEDGGQITSRTISTSPVLVDPEAKRERLNKENVSKDDSAKQSLVERTGPHIREYDDGDDEEEEDQVGGEVQMSQGTKNLLQQLAGLTFTQD